MSTYTTYKIGGTVRDMLFPKQREDFAHLAYIIAKTPYLVMGGGANMLFGDGHFDATIINLSHWNGITNTEKKTIEVKSGTPLLDLVNFTCENSIGGYDFLAGIPGSVGGAVFMNAGAWGKYIESITKAVEIYDLKTHSFRTLDHSNLTFSYRKQQFLTPTDIVTTIWLDGSTKDQDARTKANEIIAIRKEKHPPEPSCGSVFKNPTGRSSVLGELTGRFNPHIDKYSYPAGKLIESLGLKGYTIGGAMISPKHANFIVNTHKASYRDVSNIISHTKQTIKKTYDIDLIPEVKMIESTKSPYFHTLSN